MASPAAAAVVASAHQTPVSSVGGGGDSLLDPRFKQNRPTGLMITQPPGMFTVPPGLSPATLLDSPSFFGIIWYDTPTSFSTSCKSRKNGPM
ncbi:hypothetical protein F2Q69_00024402 [Brassica cretica]|uniref:Uncharacterized protein n=1 Tax=Brassica cretica TaxID=69181 RepID=A0A8S9QMD1_BRACR|nr:hypothetical protein F2Q69_00024402 [Brassica cretica]